MQAWVATKIPFHLAVVASQANTFGPRWYPCLQASDIVRHQLHAFSYFLPYSVLAIAIVCTVISANLTLAPLEKLWALLPSVFAWENPILMITADMGQTKPHTSDAYLHGIRLGKPYCSSSGQRDIDIYQLSSNVTQRKVTDKLLHSTKWHTGCIIQNSTTYPCYLMMYTNFVIGITIVCLYCYG